MPRPLTVLLLPPLVLTLLLASPTSAPAEDRSARAEGGPASVRIEGRGYGHGHGLSQYGAQNRARQGQTYRQIVGFYYRGLRWGRAAGKVSVHITGDRSTDVVVSARSRLKARQVRGARKVDLGPARPQARKWRLVPVAGGRTRLDYFVSRWRRHTLLGGAAEFTAGGPPITLHLGGRTRVAYRGALRAIGGDTVNVVPLDSYLLGVVPQEVPALWHAQAVRAQAVAARTYAAFERARPLARHYQICDTAQCQVYGGYSAEHPASNAAVRATAGQVLTANGRPAFTQFSASNGGWASRGAFAYLPDQRDPFDAWSGNPYRSWTTTVRAASIEGAFLVIGDFTGLRVTRRDGNGAWGGRATKVRITGSAGSTTVSGDTFRSYFGLRSTLFRPL